MKNAMRIQFKLRNFKFKSDSKIDSFTTNNKHKIVFATSVDREISFLTYVKYLIQTWKEGQRNKSREREMRVKL